LTSWSELAAEHEALDGKPTSTNAETTLPSTQRLNLAIDPQKHLDHNLATSVIDSPGA
jgi:hypothetical protein